MNQPIEKRKSGILRYYVTTHRTSSLRVVTFDGVARKQHSARIVDISIAGVGVESNELIEPGLVCFGEHVGGHKLGVVSWCKQSGDGYRAGISFVTLPYEKEQYILNEIASSRTHQPLRDPENIIAGLLKSFKRETAE